MCRSKVSLLERGKELAPSVRLVFASAFFQTKGPFNVYWVNI